MTNQPHFSLIIPGLNEEQNIGPMLDDLAHQPFVSHLGPRFEVVVVDDGSTDRMAEAARAKASLFSQLRVLRLSPNVGKGYAITRGIEESTGAVVGFVDGDNTFALAEVERFYEAIQVGHDVVIGDRRSKDSSFRVPASAIPYIHLRAFVGERFNFLVRNLTPLRVLDTQCGFKLFSRRAAQHCFSRILVGGFVFDLEVLLAAHAADYRIASLPVRLNYKNPEPTSEVFSMSLGVGRNLVRVLLNHRAGKYGT